MAGSEVPFTRLVQGLPAAPRSTAGFPPGGLAGNRRARARGPSSDPSIRGSSSASLDDLLRLGEPPALRPDLHAAQDRPRREPRNPAEPGPRPRRPPRSALAPSHRSPGGRGPHPSRAAEPGARSSFRAAVPCRPSSSSSSISAMALRWRRTSHHFQPPQSTPPAMAASNSTRLHRLAPVLIPISPRDPGLGCRDRSAAVQSSMDPSRAAVNNAKRSLGRLDTSHDPLPRCMHLPSDCQSRRAHADDESDRCLSRIGPTGSSSRDLAANRPGLFRSWSCRPGVGSLRVCSRSGRSSCASERSI